MQTRSDRAAVSGEVGGSAGSLEDDGSAGSPVRDGIAGVVGRRGLLSAAAAAGAATAAAGALAACGAAGQEGSAAPSSSSGTASAGKALAPAADIPVRGGKIFASEKVVVTQPSAGQYKGFSATCTHMGCTVGSVSGGLIRCPCHGSEYSITDGSVKGGPAPKPLPAVPLAVKNGQIAVA
jgi:Rieske Fe-S protein